MTREEFDDIKPRLLIILRDSSPLPPRELLNRLVEDVKLADSEASNAICRLIDDGDRRVPDVRLRLDRKFDSLVTRSFRIGTGE